MQQQRSFMQCRGARALADKYGTSDPKKICEKLGKDYVCDDVILANKKRVHVEFAPDGIRNCWEPHQNCTKSSCKVQGQDYGALNEKSNRFHKVEGKGKGQFVKGTTSPPDGLVTSDTDRTQFRYPKTGSPRSSPFAGEGESSPTEGGGGGAGGADGGPSKEGGGAGTSEPSKTHQKTTNAKGETVTVTREKLDDKNEKTDCTLEKETKDTNFGRSLALTLKPWRSLYVIRLL